MSEKIRVLMTKKYFDEDIAYMRAGLDESIELVAPADYTVEAIAEEVKGDYPVLLGGLFAKEVLDNAKNTKLLQIPWTGVDQLNFELLRQYDYTVCNSHSNSTAVAELIVSLLLSVAKWIPFHDRNMRQGNWLRPQRGVPDSFFPPDMISDSTVVVAGYGAIGQKVVKFLSGLGAKCLAVDDKEYDETPDGLEAVYKPDQLMEAVKLADYFVLTIPLTPQTRGLINKQVFEAMKPSAYLINTSRGAIVAEEDLYNALSSKTIAGAAIDVWYNYPKSDNPTVMPSKDYPFQELDNLVLSPHRAGFTRGGHPHLDDAIENLNRFARGQELINVVHLDLGY